MRRAGRIFSFLLAAAVCLSLWAVPSAAYMEYEPVYAAGDVNNDSQVTATDALIALQTAVGKTTLGYDETDAADVDGNWTVNATDALITLQHSVGKTTLEGTAALNADVNADNAVNATDALLILQYSVGKITKFPVEEK